MNVVKYPEDSVLRRHFDAIVEMKRQHWLQMTPSDSILRRHTMSPGSHPTYRSSKTASGVTSPTSNSAPATRARQMATQETGFFARLFSLFSRKT